jgi:hypothetical protein
MNYVSIRWRNATYNAYAVYDLNKLVITGYQIVELGFEKLVPASECEVVR